LELGIVEAGHKSNEPNDTKELNENSLKVKKIFKYMLVSLLKQVVDRIENLTTSLIFLSGNVKIKINCTINTNFGLLSLIGLSITYRMMDLYDLSLEELKQ
jgi:hypothetical protein